MLFFAPMALAETIPTLALAGPLGGSSNSSRTAVIKDTINVKAAPYYAKGDGLNDDTTAIQSALNDECATGKSVYFPPTPGSCYSISQPLRITCKGHIFGSGPSASKVCPKFSGPALAIGGPGDKNLKIGTTLLPGVGGSLDTSQYNPGLDLEEAPPLRHLNGLHALAVEVFFKVTSPSASHDILAPTVLLGSGTSAISFSLRLDGSNHLYGCLHMSIGGNVCVTSGSVVRQNQVDEAELDLTGGKLYLFFNGRLQNAGGTSARGTIVQSYFEQLPLPAWQRSFLGFIDSIRFSDIARHTSSYSMPIAKLASDRNTLLLLNWPTVGIPDGMTQGYVGISKDFRATPVQFLVAHGGSADHQISGLDLDGLELCGGSYLASALVATWTYNSRFHELTCLGEDVGLNSYEPSWGFYFDSIDFQNVVENLAVSGAFTSFYFGPNSNNVSINNLGSDGASVALWLNGGGSFGVRNVTSTDRGVLMFPFIFNGATGVLQRLFVDSEGPSPNLGAMVYDTSNWAQLTVLNPEFDAVINVPAIEFNGTNSAPFILSGGSINSARVIAGGPVDASAGNKFGSGTSVVVPSVTTTLNNDAILVCAAQSAGGYSVSAGSSRLGLTRVYADAGKSTGCWFYQQANAGASGIFKLNSTGAGFWAAMQTGLEPVEGQTISVRGSTFVSNDFPTTTVTLYPPATSRVGDIIVAQIAVVVTNRTEEFVNPPGWSCWRTDQDGANVAEEMCYSRYDYSYSAYTFGVSSGAFFRSGVIDFANVAAVSPVVEFLAGSALPGVVRDMTLPTGEGRTNAGYGQYLSIQQNGKDEQSTVAALWSCANVNRGTSVDVTDCSSCVFGATCTGGGAAYCREVCTGTEWIAE
jgi:hypothetical protein